MIKIITVKGAVQGVGYRPFIAEKATEYGFSGYVKNIGAAVEILISGKEADIASFICLLEKEMPQGAYILSVNAFDAPSDTMVPEGFSIIESSEIKLNDEFGGPSFRKPDPHGFKVMAGRLGTDPSSMIYIGDNPSKDFHIAADLPVRTARIIREKGIYNNRSYLDDIHETWRIDALTDILSIIDDQNGHKDREKE